MAPSRLDQGTLTILTQTTGDVRVSTSPRLTEGIGEGGLVLVRAVVAESDVVVDPVPVKPPGMFRVVLIRIEIKETRTNCRDCRVFEFRDDCENSSFTAVIQST